MNRSRYRLAFAATFTAMVLTGIASILSASGITTTDGAPNSACSGDPAKATTPDLSFYPLPRVHSSSAFGAAQQFSTSIADLVETADPNDVCWLQWPRSDPVQVDQPAFAQDDGPAFGPELSGSRMVLVEWHAEASTASQGATIPLGGTSWQLVKFQGSDDTTLTPDDKAKYTIAFETDGHVRARLDCNRGRGTWESSGPNQLQFGPLALTRATCPPGSLYDRLAKDWAFVRSYIIKDGHLFLSLMADGGIYEFEPMGKSLPTSP
jgi:para-nitrobenzyl esterase